MSTPQSEGKQASVIALTRFRADLARALSRRAERILSASDLEEQVKALEPLEAYLIVKEIGVDEAQPILRCATPEQLRTFVDLDCWTQEDRLDAAELDVWLAAVAQEGPEALAEAFLSLEDEVQVVFLLANLQVYDAREDELPEPDREVRRANTPDTFFVIELAELEVERELDPFFLVDALYRHDTQEAYKLMMAVRWELASVLEDQAMQFRSARVEELGFPPRDVAAKLFASPPAQPRAPVVAKMAVPTTLPAVYAAPLTEVSLLGRALSAVDDASLLEQLERDLVHLVNMAVIAFGNRPGDVAHATETAARVRDTVSLGIECVLSPAAPLADAESAAAAAAAAGVLAAWSVQDLFRRGHQEVMVVAREAYALARDPVVKAWLEREDPDAPDYGPEQADRAFLRALATTPPAHAGFDALRPRALRGFASKSELEAARRRLDAIHARVG